MWNGIRIQLIKTNFNHFVSVLRTTSTFMSNFTHRVRHVNFRKKCINCVFLHPVYTLLFLTKLFIQPLLCYIFIPKVALGVFYFSFLQQKKTIKKSTGIVIHIYKKITFLTSHKNLTAPSS